MRTHLSTALDLALTTALKSTLVTLLLATPLAAHGGQYKGPADAGTAGNSTQGGTAPPTSPGGAAGPAPGSPTRPGGASTTSGGYGRMGSERLGGKLGSDTGTAFLDDSNYEIWEFWWEHNKDRFLALKQRLVRTSSVSGSLGVLTGRGPRSAAASSRRPSPERIRQEVLPVLRELATTSTDRDILDSTLLALGRSAGGSDARAVLETVRPLLAHGELSVQSAATLALGVLGSPEATPALRELLGDSSQGRQLVGGGEVPWMVRAFAALSLGLVGDEQAVDMLLKAFEKLDDSDRDIRVCALVGLALVTDEALVPRIAAELEGQLGARNLDDAVRSYIPTTLGKLGQHASVAPLLSAFVDRDTPNLVRQSAAIGLGRLATVEDGRVLDALRDCIAEGRDVQTRHFAFISLAKIGARDEHAAAHERILGTLLDEIGRPSRASHRSWAALAAALYARAHLDAQADAIERVADAYAKERDPSFKAAFALSLGLLEARAEAGRLHADFMESADKDFQGYAAVALGFLKHSPAAPQLRAIVRDKGTPPTFRLQAATALGLMGDEQAVDVLVDTLQTAQTLGVSSAAAKALGLIGDQAALAPLLALATDEQHSELTRAFAAVALGLLGEKSELPWNARVSEDNNYRAPVTAIGEVLDIL